MATGGVSDLDQGTDETFDFLCSMCQGQNKNTEGEHFCADCSDYYCSSCIKVHNAVPALKNHKILNKAQFMLLSSVHFPAVPTERCGVHGHKPVDMFCQQHDSVGCATCMVVKHSDCKEKFYVPDYIKNNSTTSASPHNVIVQMDALANSVAELQKEFIKENEDLKSCKDKSLKQIQKWRLEINGLLDVLENKTIQELEQRFQSLTENIEATLQELQTFTNHLQSAQNSLKSAGGNMAQTFVSIKMANEFASLAQEIVNTTKRQVSSIEVSFIPHQKLQSFLKEMQALGDISLPETLQSKSTATDSLKQLTKNQTSRVSTQTPSTTATMPPVTITQTSHTPLNDQSTTATFPPVSKTQTSHTSLNDQSITDTLPPITMTQTSHTSLNDQSTTATLLSVTATRNMQQSHESQSKPYLLQVKGKKKYTVKVKSDNNTCCIVSACTLADGTIILADNYNRKLKRVNSTSYSVTDCCRVPDSPQQVCAITEQEVALCCDLSKLIQFVSIGRTLHKTRQIKTGFSCYALACADKKLFVSDWDTVYVYSLTGDRQQQFRKDQSGQQLFSYIRSVAVSSDHSKIFVADSNKGLIILDKTGMVVGLFNGSKLDRARVVCLYTNDSILVCGYFSKNVLQFNPNGKLLNQVVNTDEYCQAVCCNKDNTKLIVGLYEEAEIEVYDIY